MMQVLSVKKVPLKQPSLKNIILGLLGKIDGAEAVITEAEVGTEEDTIEVVVAGAENIKVEAETDVAEVEIEGVEVGSVVAEAKIATVEVGIIEVEAEIIEVEAEIIVAVVKIVEVRREGVLVSVHTREKLEENQSLLRKNLVRNGFFFFFAFN